MTDNEVISDAFVSALYGAFLRRAPDGEGLAFHKARFKEAGFQALIESFLYSAEYGSSKMTAPSLDLNWAPPMRVQTDLANAELDRLWTHVGEVWTSYGVTDPYWSVLTDDRFRNANMEKRDVLEAFYSSGINDVNYLRAFLTRAGLALRPDMVVAEYGCGVGRVTQFLAKEVQRVLAFDISRPHLDAAHQYMEKEQCENVEYIHVTGRRDLDQLKNIDLFFSLIVLQHNPPPVILDILTKAFQGLRSGGIAFFQVPVYARDYEFDVSSFWAGDAARKSMEMHFVPQHIILRVAKENNLYPLQISPDHCVGNYERWLSNTFLLQKT